jgi:thioredoxin-like negative regulator of GroEL
MSSSDTLQPTLDKANKLVREGDYPNAARLFQEVFANEPGNTGALRGLAQAMLQLDQHDVALALLADSINPDWPDSSTVLQISRILQSLHRDDEAADLLFASVHADPANIELRVAATALISALNRTDDLKTLSRLQSGDEVLHATAGGQ